MKLYDSNTVLLSPTEHHTARAEMNNDSDIVNAVLQVSVGTRQVHIHSNKGDIKAFKRKMKIILKSLDKLLSWKDVDGVNHYRNWLNPIDSAMGGTVYVFCENIADEKSEMYGFFELADCTRKLRIFLDEKAHFVEIEELQKVVANFVKFLDKYK